jgi:hypothetical protein
LRVRLKDLFAAVAAERLDEDRVIVAGVLDVVAARHAIAAAPQAIGALAVVIRQGFAGGD